MNEEEQPQKTSGTGLDPNVAGLLCYVLGWITGLIFFLLEKDDKFVRFHAAQSMITFGGLFVLQILFYGFWFVVPVLFYFSSIIWLAVVVLWIVLMVKAYQGEKFKLPIVGDIAEGMA